MPKGRFVVGITLALLCAGAVSPLVARACSVSTFFRVSPASGAAGSQAVLFGGAFAPAPVDVYWSTASGQIAGAPLIVLAGPNFSNVPVSIPSTATAGFYWLVATDNSGPIQSVSQPFQVTAGAPPPPPPSQPSGPPVASGTAPTNTSSVVTAAQAPAVINNAANSPEQRDATSNIAVSSGAAQDQPAAASPQQPSVANPPAPRRVGSPAQGPNFAKIPGDATTSAGGLPASITVGLAFAGVAAVLAAVGALIMLPRRRRSLAQNARDASREPSDQ